MSDSLPQNVLEAMDTIAEFVTGHDKSGNGGFDYTGPAKVHHVEDGDTLYATYRADPAITIGKLASQNAPDGVDEAGMWLRLIKVDTHETDANDKQTRQQAMAEKQFVENFVQQGRQHTSHEWPFLVAYRGDDIEGTYGRQLTDLIRRSDGRSLTAALFDEFDDVKYEPAF